MPYLPRWIAERVRRGFEAAPVTVLTGARQVGKSTLLRNEEPFASWRYVSFDDLDVLAQASRDPRELWAGADAVVLDEVQRAPGVLSAVKAAVDASRRAQRFLLSGSANLLLMRSVSESLAGRAVYQRLSPFMLGEAQGRSKPTLLEDLLQGRLPQEGQAGSIDPVPHLFRGMMPPLLDVSDEAVPAWWEGYVMTYLERDLRQQMQVGSLPEFRGVLMHVAARTGSVFNQTDVARSTGVSQPTVHRYLGVLEASHLVVRLPGFAVSVGQRLSKRPKVYLFDTGLCSYLLGLYSGDDVARAREKGMLFENLVVQHVIGLADLLAPRADVFYWRTSSGAEVDLVIAHGRTLLPIEVKATTRPSHDDLKGVRAFLDSYGDSVPAALLVYGGSEVVRMGERIVAVPWHVLAGAGSSPL